MVKKICSKKLLFLFLFTQISMAETMLERNCMSCHIKEKIPSELIYRRYLTKYSSPSLITQKLLIYLKSPKKEYSIMPKQFFLKFPQKRALDLNETILTKSIKAYLGYFDIKKRLVLQESL